MSAATPQIDVPALIGDRKPADPSGGRDRLKIARPFNDSIRDELLALAERRFAGLQPARAVEFAHWLEIAQYIAPRRGQWLITDPKLRGKMHGKIINNRAERAGKVLASGMQSGLTSRSRPWFSLAIGAPGAKPDNEAKTWLRDVEDLLYAIFDRSNFYETLRINYAELGHWATGAFSIVPDFDSVIRCRQHTIGSYYLGVDHKNNHDTFAEEFVLTTDQMVDRYEWDRLSRPVQQSAKSGRWDATTLIRRITMPNRVDFKAGAAGWRGAPFMTIEYDRADRDKSILSITPDYEFPVIVPRWETIPDYAYGSSCPGMEALADQKQLQVEEINLSRARAHVGNPALVMPPELRSEVNGEIQPGDRLYVSELAGQKGVRRAFDLGNTQELEATIDRIQNRIDLHYHLDVFQAISRIEGGNMRVVEIDARVREQMAQLGPIVESLNNSQNDPAIFRVYRIAERAGLIPDPPDSIKGQPIRIRYVSILAQAQVGSDLDKLDRFFVAVQGMSTVDPTSRFRLNSDEWIQAYGERLGVPPRVIRGDKEAKALAAADAQQAAIAQAAANAQANARAAKDASQASLEGDTALTAARDAYQPGGAR